MDKKKCFVLSDKDARTSKHVSTFIDRRQLDEERTDNDKPTLLKEMDKKPLVSLQPQGHQAEKCPEKAVVLSDEILRAIVIVIEHFRSTYEEQKNKLNVDGAQERKLDIEDVRNLLSTRFSSVSQTSSHPKYESHVIQDRDVSSAQSKELMRGNTSETHSACPERDDDIKRSFIEKCVNVCRECIPMPEGAKEFLRAIFNLAYDKKPIDDYLNLPTLGSYIPTELHSFLDQYPRDFKAGQYVAYEVFDPVLLGEDGDAVYVVARILDMAGDTTDNVWQRMYKIDIGEITEVPGADLYAFLGKLHTLITGTDPETPPSSGEDIKSVQEMRSEIDHQLNEAWHTDETTGKKAAKRLLLKWLRAKNPCKSQAVEQIYELVKRLELKTKPESPKGSFLKF